LVITSEVEITHIMDGLKSILYVCLDIDNGQKTIKEEFNYLNRDSDDESQSLGQKLKNLFSTSEFNA